MTDLRVQAEAEHLRQQQARLDAERQSGEKARAEREFRRLAEGGLTDRQVRAVRYVSYLEAIARGRWTPHDEASGSKFTQLDNGHALGVLDRAAQEAVSIAIQPLLEQARAEVEAASRERLAILERGRL